MKVLQDRSLVPFHTFGIDVDADKIVEAETADELALIWQAEEYRGVPKLIVGQGSNLLFCEPYAGLIILNRIKGIEITETSSSYLLHVGSGEDWHQLVKTTVENNIPGLENLALIPGCVGSSPIQNIGAYGVELQDVCQYVDVVELATGKSQRLSASECLFGYRDSVFKHALKNSHAITAVGIELTKAWSPNITYGPLAKFDAKTVSARDIFHEVCAVRQSKLPDPAEMGNAGSFFKNPVISAEHAATLTNQSPNMPCYQQPNGEVKVAAGWLIDQCGLKGFQIGGARVHDNQALVLVNYHDASADDVIALAQHVVNSVESKFNITLEHEVRFIAATAETSLAEFNR
ncbi:UDP-N-acetylmuramate dehydrogenase [Photobacterium sanctipauli]|uniref:UDP-N-acetylenolpyruvoylglucosamine reductase n=1 Tax=Photobacterium sanctipauli TaxID=1342794 RepID=A0A2T3ND06_9GAMM|nr:UDP-N-acetylmuramate dehydrogenase [Photobacterium sanctipauli]PSW12126.1 UDP-N-acetylmuramate dehydrogenase [Photobacterium sanctipauli]